MADDDRVGTIRENVATILAEIRAINQWMAKSDQRWEATEKRALGHDTEIAILRTDVALLKNHSARETSNWDKVWDILKPAMVAVIVAILMTVMR